MAVGTQFEATQAFSGDGFISTQSAEVINSTPSSAKSAQRTTESLPILPMTVKQLSEASQSGDEKSKFVINGVDVNMVELVGLVFDKSARSSDVGFYLDDGTGRVFCIKWMAEATDAREMEELEDGRYYQVCGRLQSVQGKNQLAVFGFRPITEFDEVTFHFIECIKVHLQNSKLQLPNCIDETQDQSFITPVRPSSSSVSQSVQSSNLSVQFSADGLKNFDKMVLSYLQQPSSMEREMGVHVDEISNQLKVPNVKIRDAIDTLEREGLVYSSIDDDHYKAVEGC